MENKTRTKFNIDKDIDKRSYNGIIFDSKLEMNYFRDVILPLEESGDIVYFELQKTYELQPKFIHDDRIVLPIKYIADFFVRYKNGEEEVIDTKGMPDSVALIKRKLFWYNFPTIKYSWKCYSKKFGGWIDYEEYKRFKREEKTNK